MYFLNRTKTRHSIKIGLYYHITNIYINDEKQYFLGTFSMKQKKIKKLLGNSSFV